MDFIVGTIFGVVAINIVVVVLLVYVFKRLKRVTKRHEYLKAYHFSDALKAKIKQQYPTLRDAQVDEVLELLRQFFSAHQFAGKKAVNMPSRVVDFAWHEFILFTREYSAFCEQAFGRFLHHNPPSKEVSAKEYVYSKLRIWNHACHQEGIDRKSPKLLPRIFAIDGTLGITGALLYSIEKDVSLTPHGVENVHAWIHETLPGGGSSGDGGGDSGDSCSSCGGD